MNSVKLTKYSKYFKINKRKRKQLQALGKAVVFVLAGVLIGLIFADHLVNKPSNTRIWAADETVVIPDDLYNFLQQQPDCMQPITGQPGVRLWAVMQVEQASFARLAYGCSTELQQYQMAVRVEGNWQLLKDKDYFADSAVTSLPSCNAVSKYTIPSAIEPFCINSKGKAEANE